MSIGKGMDKENVRYVYTGILAVKIEKNNAICMDLEIVTQNEVSQKEKEKCHIMLLICGI